MGWDGPNLVFRDGTISLLCLLRGWSGHSFLFDMRDKGEWDGWRIRHRCALFVINETHVLISRPHYFSFIYKKTPSMAQVASLPRPHAGHARAHWSAPPPYAGARRQGG